MTTLINPPFDLHAGFVGCSSPIGCAEVAATTLVWLLLWVGGSSLLLFAQQANIRAAKEVLATECHRVEAEQLAFDEFARQVDSVVPTTPPAPEPPANLLTDGDDSLHRIREAYRETVMAVDHYEEDYGEPLERHLTIEFGDDVATAVLSGDGMPPGLPAALTNRAREARVVRKQYLDTLAEERQRLEDGERSLSAIAEDCEELDERHLRMVPFRDLADRWDRLRDHRTDLESVVSEHQERVREEMSTWSRDHDPTSFFEFLYEELTVAFPVLADGLVLKRRMEGLDQRLTSALAGRP